MKTVHFLPLSYEENIVKFYGENTGKLLGIGIPAKMFVADGRTDLKEFQRVIVTISEYKVK